MPSATPPAASVPILGIARPGWPIILGLLLFTSILAATGVAYAGPAGLVPGLLLLIVTIWAVWFFRDPERRPPPDPNVIVSAADGVVCAVGPAAPPAELGMAAAEAEGLTRVSVFMNIFDVHVNRAPADVHVKAIHYRPGRFVNASLDKASEHNERLSLGCVLRDGRPIVIVQIAGLIARRIVCWSRVGDTAARAARIGMIRFGSRVDVYLPPGLTPSVRVGDRVHAGRSVIASMISPPLPRTSGRTQAVEV